MKSRFHIAFAALFLLWLQLVALRATAQDSQDNQPHIQPRATPTPTLTPTPTPTPRAAQPSQKQDGYDRPAFPGDAPGTRPAEPPQKKPDQYERPPFPGDAPAPAGTQQGESSSRDSEIDLTPRPGKEPAPAPPPEEDESMLKPWDPHKAAKDVEVGNYYLKLKNYRAALERFNHALIYKANDAEATYGLALTQEKLGLLALASKNYSKYLEIVPNGPKAKEATQGIERLSPQITALKPASAPADPAKESAHDIDVGETYLSANNYDAARERFEDALRLNPENALACFRLAQSLQGMQRLDSARMYYRKYLELQPKGKFASNAKKAIGDIDFVLGK